MSGVLWQRLIQHGRRFGMDARITTELGRMFWRRELTTTQTVAGFRVAEIYGQFERSQGLPRRTSRSPAYDGAYRWRFEDDEDFAATARDNWRRFQTALPGFALRQLIEQLCVDDQAINPTQYDEIRKALDRIALVFRIRADKDNATATDVPLHFNAHEEQRR